MHSAEQHNFSHETEVIPPRNLLTAVVDHAVAEHPELWSADNQPLFGREDSAALSGSNIGVKYENEESQTGAYPVSEQSWLVGIYGGHWRDTPDGFVLESTTVENMTEVHKDIAELLKDENPRPSKIVDETIHEKVGNYTDEGIYTWLETLHNGNSPIFATGHVDSQGQPLYLTHDFTDWHTASNLLWGRATQDRVTVASGYQLDRIRNGETPSDRKKAVPGNGIEVIDRITCSSAQINLINYAMYGPGDMPKERMTQLWEQFHQTDFDSKDAWRAYEDNQHREPAAAAAEAHILQAQVEDLEDFIQWHASGDQHRATSDQKDRAFKDALTDITRVAERLLGIYDGTDVAFHDRPAHIATDEEEVYTYEPSSPLPDLSYFHDTPPQEIQIEAPKTQRKTFRTRALQALGRLAGR